MFTSEQINFLSFLPSLHWKLALENNTPEPVCRYSIVLIIYRPKSRDNVISLVKKKTQNFSVKATSFLYLWPAKDTTDITIYNGRRPIIYFNFTNARVRLRVYFYLIERMGATNLPGGRYNSGKIRTNPAGYPWTRVGERLLQPITSRKKNSICPGRN